jgi:two-component system, OmpR family, phosphate regulon response regulator PhoB
MKSPESYAHTDVLLVEDDPQVGAMYRLQLAHDGHRVRLVGDGNGALAQALLSLPDLILLDFKLPGADGLTVLERLRQEPSLRYVPVVMLSNYHEPELVERGQELGVVEWVLKSQTAPSVLSAQAGVWARGTPALSAAVAGALEASTAATA